MPDSAADPVRLVVHWSPVKNTRQILRLGIQKGRRGLYCSPLFGVPLLDRAWPKMFRECHWKRSVARYNGFVFRLTQADMPAAFSNCGMIERHFEHVGDLWNYYKEYVLGELWATYKITAKCGYLSPEMAKDSLAEYRRQFPELAKRLSQNL